MSVFYRSKANTKSATTRKSASFLTSSSRTTHARVRKARTFFQIGGLSLTVGLTVVRPGVKELAGLSGHREHISFPDRL
jgi:hypothetical protein